MEEGWKSINLFDPSDLGSHVRRQTLRRGAVGIEHIVANQLEGFAGHPGTSGEEAEEQEEAVGGPGCEEGFDEAVVGYG